jgi:hypothetical protein
MCWNDASCLGSLACSARPGKHQNQSHVHFVGFQYLPCGWVNAGEVDFGGEGYLRGNIGVLISTSDP